MEQSYIEKDKQNRPVMIVEISPEEIALLKLAIENHPKLNIDDAEGRRFKVLLKKEDWNRLPRITVADLNEVTNKYIQDHEGEDATDMQTMKDKLNELRKAMVDVK